MRDRRENLSELSDASASLLRAGRNAHDPSPADRARLDAAFLARLSGGAPGASSAGTKTASGRWFTPGGLLKLAIGVACVAGASLAALQDTESRTAPTPALQSAQSAAAEVLPRVDQPQPPAPTVVVATEAREGAHLVEGRQLRTQLRRANRNPPSQAPVLREVRGLHISSEALAPREGTHEREGEGLATEAKSVRLTHAHEAAKAPQSPLTPHAASLHADVEVLNDPTPSPVQSKDPRKGPTQAERDELTLVAGMQAALKTSDFAAALALCAEHERGWPHGVFAMEREGVRAIASCAGGSDGARVVAKRFLAEHAHTTLALRVKAACVAQLAAAPRP